MTAQTDDSQPDRRWLARQVLEGLLSSIRFGSQGPARWDAAEPYLLRQAIAHAVDAGQVDELLSDLEFLVHADPETLLPELRRANTPRTRLLAAVYRASSRFHEVSAPAVRRQLLSLDAARYQVHDVASRLSSPEEIPLSQFAPVWCTSAQVDTALVSTIQEETWIRSIALDTLGAREVAIAGGDDGSVRIYDLATAEPLGLPLTGPTDVIRSVTTGTRDGRRIVLAAGDDRAMHLWDLASGEPVRLGKDRQAQIVASGRPIEAIAFTLVGTMPVAITGGGDRIIRVWNVMTGKLVRELRGHRNSVTSLACGALDGEPIAVSGGQDGIVRVWSLADGREIVGLSGSDTWVHSVAVATIGESVLAIAGGSDSLVRIWDLRDGHPVANLRGHSGSISSVAPIRIDDHLTVASADSEGAVYLWDLADHDRAPRIITGHTKPVSALATGLFEARQVALSGGGDGTIRMWDLTAVISRDRDQDIYHAGDVSALAFTTVDDQLMVLSGGEDGTIRLWDARAGSAVSAFHIPARLPALPEELTPGYSGTEVHALAAAVIDGYPCLVAGAGQSRLLLRYLASADDSVLELDGHEDVVSAVATVETDDRVVAVSGGDDSLLRVWDLRTRSLLYPPLEGHDGWINAIDARLLEGRPVAASGGDDGTVRIWDLSDGRQLGPTLRDGTDSINAVLLVTLDGSPTVIAAGDDAHIRVWDLASGQVTKVMAGHVQPVLALATAPGPGSLLVSGGKDAVLRFWDLASGRQTAAYHMPGEIPAIAVAPDSTIMVAFGWEIAAFLPAAQRLHQKDPQKGNDNDVNRVLPVGIVRAVGREWLMVPGDILTFGRGSDRDIRFAHDPVDDFVSHQAGTLIAVDGGLLVRNDSRTQSISLIAVPGQQQQIGPGMVIQTMPQTRIQLVVPGRYGAIYPIHLDLRDLVESVGQAAASPVSADRLPTRSGPGALTPSERRILAALCEPLLIFAGPAPVAASYGEIARRTGETRDAVRITLDNLRNRLTDRDGIPGLRPEDDSEVPGSDYRAALARWALNSWTITADDLRLLGPRHP